MLELYHFEPVANSMKPLLCLSEKGVEFTSRQLNLDGKRWEQYSDWFLKINPDGQVPVLVHDGKVIVESTVINEYIEDVFPQNPLRPADPYWRAQMRIWTKYVDEYICPALTVIGANFATAMAQKIDKKVMQDVISRIPLDGPRKKWETVSSTGYSDEELADARRRLKVAIDKAEKALSEHEWLGAPTYSLADVNAYSMLSGAVRVSANEITEAAYPRVHDWLRRMEARPGMKKALSYPGMARPTAPAEPA
ncbi:MAG: glutathione S-transferase family protein [Caulobacteraceae bacterium]